MKKSIFTFAMLLSIFSIVFSSCGKDEPIIPGQQEGTYTIKLDGNTVATGTSLSVGWSAIPDDRMVAQIINDDFSISVAPVSKEIGSVINFNTEDGNTTSEDGIVDILGKNLLLTDGSDERYISTFGSITRVSETKISFEGTCTYTVNDETHTFSGTLESDEFKIEY